MVVAADVVGFEVVVVDVVVVVVVGGVVNQCFGHQHGVGHGAPETVTNRATQTRKRRTILIILIITCYLILLAKWN